MSWKNINLSQITTQLEDLLPAGFYTWELLPGAKYNETNGAIQAHAAVVNGGEFNGKRGLLYFPDPESVAASGKSNSWASIAFKRFEQAIGVDVEEGEDKVAYLNRVAGARFGMPVKHSPVTDQYPTPKANLQLLNVKAAA